MKISIGIIAAILASTAGAQTFRVAGIVVDSETSAPLGRTRVFLIGGPVQEQSFTTAGNGKFSFNVPAGKYTLFVAHRDFGDRYGQTRSGSSDSAIVTGADQDTTGIVMRWHAPVAIHGKVLDESGEPVHAATVELFVEAVTGGRKRIVWLGKAESDELGNYSWSSLPEGTYYLAAVGEPWYFSDPTARRTLIDAGKSLIPYALTYFPGANDPRAATPLRLHPGANLQANITLRPASANLRFVCASAPCGGSASLFAVGLGGLETLFRTTDVFETGVIPAVPPGRYVLRYIGPKGSTRKVFEVGGGDLTIEIAPRPAPTLMGRVTIQNPKDQLRHALYVNLQDEDTGQSFAVPVSANGSYIFPAVPASRVRMYLSGADGFFVTRMSVDGASVKDGVLEIVDGVRVQVILTASGETGTLRGFVTDSVKPVPTALVVLAPPKGSINPNDYRVFETDSDGSFDFAGVPAGDCVLFAVDNLEFEYTNLEVVRPYLARGKQVQIKPYGTGTENVSLSPVLQK
jgi:hypothetical protein